MSTNTIALVTGVSSGIGRATAQLLVEHGARVFGAVRVLRRTNRIGKVELVRMDVTDDTSVKAWVFVGILQGLEEMYRIRIPVLDVFGERDWDVTRWGAEERKAQIERVPGSAQVVVPKATHFFERQEEDLLKIIVGFLDGVFQRR